MSKIKIKPTSDIKATDKASSFTHRVKDVYVRNKEQAEQSHQAEEHSPVQYAEGKVQSMAEGIARRAGNEARHQGRAAIRKLAHRGIRQWERRTHQHQQDTAGQQCRTDVQPKIMLRSMKHSTVRTTKAAPVGIGYRTGASLRRPWGGKHQQASSVRTSDSTQSPLARKRFIQGGSRENITKNCAIKTPLRGIAKVPIRTTKNTKTAVKTSRAVAKTTVRTAQAAAKASTRAIEFARAAAKATTVAVKTAAKAVVAVGKAIIAAIRGLIALISAGGWVAIVVILVLCLVGFLVSSPFGLFFSGENKDADVSPLAVVVQEVNADFNAKLQGIIAAHPEANRVEIAYLGSADNIKVENWMDIAAVFAVKTAMAENGMDVVTIDAIRIEIIKGIFWDMNRIDFYVETIEQTETVTVTKPDGTKEEKTETTYEYVLHISITSKTAEQQANDYGFTTKQTGIMEEMLSSQFRPLMLALLGIDASTGLSPEELEALFHNLPVGEEGAEIVRLALSRLGDPYSQPKAGQGDYTDCSYLSRWCYQQIGIYLPRTAAAQAEYCTNNGLTISPNDLAPGDLVFFSHEQNGRFMNITHVAIYAGNGYIVDASSIRGQVVYREMIGGDVIYGRPYA